MFHTHLVLNMSMFHLEQLLVLDSSTCQLVNHTNNWFLKTLFWMQFFIDSMLREYGANEKQTNK